MNQQGNPPIKEFRAGRIKAAIWRNEVEDGGRAQIRYSVKLQKRYHDRKTDEWKSTDQYFAEDLPRLELVASEAYRFIILRTSEDDSDLPTVAR